MTPIDFDESDRNCPECGRAFRHNAHGVWCETEGCEFYMSPETVAQMPEDEAFWTEIIAMTRRAYDLDYPRTDAEIEAKLDAADGVPLSEERIAEIVAYATGKTESLR